MNPSNKIFIGYVGASLLAGAAYWEGKRNIPYEDLAGIQTVCYGYTGKDIQRRFYSDKECEILLRKEVLTHSQGVLNCVTKPLKENQYNAFTLMTYNIGVSGFCTSRALRLFNEGQSSDACLAIAYSIDGTPAWSFSKGKFIQGLHNRRLYEMNMCLGVPSALSK